MPTCVWKDMLGLCMLSTNDLEIEYQCLSFLGTHKRFQQCKSLVPAETIVRSICELPTHFSFSVLPEMHCRNRMWSYKPICEPACGLTTQHLQLERTSCNQLEIPWHALIYRKNSKDCYQRCGRSLITAYKMISETRFVTTDLCTGLTLLDSTSQRCYLRGVHSLSHS